MTRTRVIEKYLLIILPIEESTDIFHE